MAKRRKKKGFDFSSYHPPDSFKDKGEEAHFLERILIPYIKKLLEELEYRLRELNRRSKG